MIIRGDSIISFLQGDSEDYRGRTFASMLEWSDEQLEYCHDQVQWMFPLHEESKHAATYPIVDRDVIEKIRAKGLIAHAIAINLIKAKDRFEKFYGIGTYEDLDKQKKWCQNYNHNLLRVTRIIRSLRLFGLPDESKDFYTKVYAVGLKLNVSKITLNYWDKAQNEDIWKILQ